MILTNIDSLITIIKEQYEEAYPSEYRGISGTLRKYAGDIGAGALGITGAAVTGNPMVGAGVYGAYKAADLMGGEHQRKEKTLPASLLAGLAGSGLALKFGPSILNKVHNYAAT